MSNELTIDLRKAKRIYPESPEWLKKELEEQFGAEQFVPKDYELIRSFEDACKKLDIDPAEELSGLTRSDEIAYRKLKVIRKAIVGEWEADFKNTEQRKWAPYFEVSPSGFRFTNTFYVYDYTHTDFGSRLCFESEEQAVYAGQQFIDIYEAFIL